MSLIAKETGRDFIPAPAGTHIARCIHVIGLGTQESDMFPAAYKIQIGWELPNERVKMQDGTEAPMVISRDYTLSLNKKSTLRQHLDAWRGRAFTSEELKGFDLKKILGVACFLNVIHAQSTQGKTYAKIAGVSGLPKGTTCPEVFHALVSYDVEDGKNEVYAKLPEWVRKKIDACEEWQPHPQQTEEAKVAEQPPTVADNDVDDIPF